MKCSHCGAQCSDGSSTDICQFCGHPLTGGSGEIPLVNIPKKVPEQGSVDKKLPDPPKPKPQPPKPQPPKPQPPKPQPPRPQPPRPQPPRPQPPSPQPPRPAITLSIPAWVLMVVCACLSIRECMEFGADVLFPMACALLLGFILHGLGRWMYRGGSRFVGVVFIVLGILLTLSGTDLDIESPSLVMWAVTGIVCWISADLNARRHARRV